MSGVVGVSRVSIPSSVRKTIQNIKEIAGSHSDEEIYAMLRECSMDPNETAQKLLFQDTFHEVKRKRDKRKEINRETTDIKWRPGSQGRGGRAGRGNYSSRYVSHDASAGRNITAGRDDGIDQIRDKDITSSQTALDTGYIASADKKSSTYMPKSIGSQSNGSIKEEHLSADDPSFSGGPSVEEIAVELKSGTSSVPEKFLSSSTGQGISSIAIASGVCTSASSDTPVVPYLDGHIPVSMDTIKHELMIRRSAGETNANRIISRGVGISEASFLNEICAEEKRNSFINGKVHGSSLELEGSLVPDTFQPAPSTAVVGTSGSRPSSNYSNRSQLASGPSKAGAKEWKPKSTNVSPAPSPEVCSTSGVDLNKGETVTPMLRTSDSMASDISKNELKLDDLHISETQHVIIPDHLQVPESERTGLSFGSFGANFILEMRSKSELEDIKCPEEPYDSSVELEESVDRPPSSASDESQLAQENTSDDQQREILENNSSSVSEIPSTLPSAAEYDQPKAAVSLVTEVSQRSAIHTAPVYSNFGLVPQMLGSSFATLDGGDIQARDTARLPGFVVQQPFDPSSNYYTSIYRPSADGDGRFSPFLAPAAPKYNGNIAALTAQSGQSPEENSNPLVLSSTGPTPLITQAAGVLQNSAAASPQPLPVFRQPAGVHISHYPPNYGPYSQYFSPFYVPPPTAIHHFLGNAPMFPQQPSTGSLYPTQTATAGTTTVKYPISQYKPATNSGPSSQGLYGMNPTSYNPSVSGGNSTGNEDLSSSQFKENYVFINGQQSEGSAVWISPPGRDISALQSGTFYNMPSHGPPVAFAPTQTGHAAFTGVYHPTPTQSVSPGSIHTLLQQSQAVGGASEIAGPAGVYQQPQRSSQINWVNNF